jgi:hypothetical protein
MTRTSITEKTPPKNNKNSKNRTNTTGKTYDVHAGY